MKREYYIYRLVDPRNKLTFYIGATRNPATRLSGHISNARRVAWIANKSGNPCDTSKAEGYIADILLSGKKPKMHVLETIECDDRGSRSLPMEVEYLEGFWWRCFIRSGNNLVNNKFRIREYWKVEAHHE